MVLGYLALAICKRLITYLLTKVHCHILSLKAGIPYNQLVKDRILNVLGMNDTKITLSQNDIKNRFPVGHMGGKEISTTTIHTIMADAGAYRSTAADMLKYVSA